MEELAFMDATAQADLVRRGEVSALDLVSAAVERIEHLNPRLNAVVTPMFGKACETAALPVNLLPEGPFTGVPFLLKDLMASYAGFRITSGSAFLEYYVADHDSELVARHKRAGLMVVGKTNTSELGILPTAEPKFFGACRNPWDPNRSTGGSSGGSAAAVASGMVPMAHANDAGGSIRIPASCCGVFGLKPTRARNPMGPDIGDAFGGMIAEHAVTRSVRDSAALLDATCGPSAGDPYWAPPNARPYVQEVGADPGRLRIAVVTEDPTGGKVHDDCVNAVRDVASLCDGLGHEIIEDVAVKFDVQTVIPAFTAVYAAGNAWAIDGGGIMSGRTPSPEKFETLTWALYEMGHGIDAPQFLLSMTALQRATREITRSFEDYDVVLTPTVTEPPPLLGTFDSPQDNPLQGLMRAASFVPFTTVANFTGLPAMSVPLHWSADGLPIGTQFIGKFGDEATLFRLAAQLEEARPWGGRRPAIHA